MMLIGIATTSASAEQMNEGQSLSGRIHYELRTVANNGKEIWLYSREDKSDAMKLCDTEGWGNLEVHFSPDEKWIVVQDGGLSLGVRCRLFRTQNGLPRHPTIGVS